MGLTYFFQQATICTLAIQWCGYWATLRMGLQGTSSLPVFWWKSMWYMHTAQVELHPPFCEAANTFFIDFISSSLFHLLENKGSCMFQPLRTLCCHNDTRIRYKQLESPDIWSLLSVQVKTSKIRLSCIACCMAHAVMRDYHFRALFLSALAEL